jgi:hypothetical protein
VLRALAWVETAATLSLEANMFRDVAKDGWARVVN